MPFSDEELALIDAIHADPRDDAPRLAYAEWLDLHGGSGAARMIVSQLSGESDTDWLRDYGRSWASPKPKMLTNLFYRRGLPEAHLAADRDPPAVKKMSPRIRIWLDVCDDAGLPDRLAHEIGTRVAVLIVYSDFSKFHSPISADAIRRLASWPQLDRIEGIQLRQPLSEEAERIFRESLKGRVAVLAKQVPTESGYYRPEIIHPYPLARPHRIPSPFRHRW